MDNNKITAREKELIEENEKLKADKKFLENYIGIFSSALGDMNLVLHKFNDLLEEEINENEKLVDPDEYERHIHILNSLINYHLRMTGPIDGYEQRCGQKLCGAKLHTDIYLAALKESLRLIEREYKRYHEKENRPGG